MSQRGFVGLGAAGACLALAGFLFPLLPPGGATEQARALLDRPAPSLLDVAAVVASNLLAAAVPLAAAGDPVSVARFETWQALFLALDLPGAALFYVAAMISIVGLWALGRGDARWLAASTALVLLGLAVTPFAAPVGGAVTAAAIVIYGVAYAAVARCAARLAGEPRRMTAPSPTASAPVPSTAAPQTARGS